MAWYAAHAIMYFKLKSGIQDRFTVWENVYLIEATDDLKAFEKAEAWAKEEASYKDDSLRIDNQPAEMLFAGIRKMITVSHQDQEGQICSKDEITYSEFQVADEESVLKLAKGEAVTIDYIDNAKLLSLQYVLSFGADKPEEFAHYFKVMSNAAGYAEEKGVKLVMKPHGGISGSSEEILRVLKEVNHRNFGIWYDAGNIIHYTGKDPVAEIDGIAPHITGFCAKDCGELKGDVMIQFGAGKVDFTAVFKRLKAGGFNGPVMVECCKVGATPEETTANARANREFLEKTLASI